MNFIQGTILALAFHWMADFALQTNEQASEKHNNICALLRHVLTYTASMAVFFICLFRDWGIFCALLTGIFHFFIDFITSRITHKLYKENRIHDFFVVIGADQFLHVSQIFILLYAIWK